MESFLSSIEIVSIDFDDDVAKYMQENKDTWLESFYDSKDWTELRYMVANVTYYQVI